MNLPILRPKIHQIIQHMYQRLAQLLLPHQYHHRLQHICLRALLRMCQLPYQLRHQPSSQAHHQHRFQHLRHPHHQQKFLRLHLPRCQHLFLHQRQPFPQLTHQRTPRLPTLHRHRAWCQRVNQLIHQLPHPQQNLRITLQGAQVIPHRLYQQSPQH